MGCARDEIWDDCHDWRWTTVGDKRIVQCKTCGTEMSQANEYQDCQMKKPGPRKKEGN